MISARRLLLTSLILGILTSSAVLSVQAQTTDTPSDKLKASISNTVQQASTALEDAIDSVTSPSPTSEATDSSDISTQEIKKRIEKALIEEKLNSKSNRKGYVGEITRITDDTLTIQTIDKTHIIPLADTDIVITKKNSRIAVGDIAVGNWAIVLGELQDDQVQAKRIIVSEGSLRPRSQKVFIGSLVSITGQKIAFTRRGENTPTEFTLSKTTSIEDADGTTLTQKKLEDEVNYLVIALEEDNKTELVAIRSMVQLVDKESE